MKRAFIFFIAPIIFFTACRVSFVPDYDASIEQQITDAAKANDKLYLDMMAADISKRTYSNYAQAYADVEADINSLALKEKARRNNNDMLQIIALIQKHFNEYKDEHKNAATMLNDAEIKDYEADMQALWLPLLLAEKGLPHTTPGK